VKILFIAPLPPPVTGHSLATKILLENLNKYHQVDVIDLCKRSFKQGADSAKRIFQVLRILKKIWQKQKDADVIYFTISESLAGNIKDLFVYLICSKKLHKMVIHLHGGSIRELLFDTNRLIFLANKYFIRRLGGAIVLGQSHVSIFSDIIEKRRVQVVPNFAENYLFVSEEDIRAKFDNTNPIRILFLSNLIEGKGHNYLVDAFEMLDDYYKVKVRIDFAGGFESNIQEKEFLSRVERNLSLQYHGIVGGLDKRNLFKHAHVLCLPTSLNEGQPISILEAYASGCAVITTDQGGIRDIFRDKTNGFLIQKKSAYSIKSVIEKIIQDPEGLFSMAMFNRKLANKRYRTSHYNGALLKIIESLA